MSVQDTLNQREKTHGSFSEHSACAQALKKVMKAYGVNYEELCPEHKEALDMIQHKVARVLCGNPAELDHWHDIQGYAALAEKACKVDNI